MTRIYQVKLFKCDDIEDLEGQINTFLASSSNNIFKNRGKGGGGGNAKSAPMATLSASGDVAMIIYSTKVPKQLVENDAIAARIVGGRGSNRKNYNKK